MTHEDVRQRLDECAGKLKALLPPVQFELEKHLGECEPCSLHRERLLFLSGGIEKLPDPQIPGGTVEYAVRRALRESRRRRPAGESQEPALSEIPRTPRNESKGWRIPRIAWALPVAVAAAIAVFAVRHRAPVDALLSPTTSAPSISATSAIVAAAPTQQSLALPTSAAPRAPEAPVLARKPEATAIANPSSPAATSVVVAHVPERIPSAAPVVAKWVEAAPTSAAAAAPTIAVAMVPSPLPMASPVSTSAPVVASVPTTAPVSAAGAHITVGTPVSEPTPQPTGLVVLRNVVDIPRGQNAVFRVTGFAGPATARIYSRSGELVRSLWTGTLTESGVEMNWNGTDDRGMEVPAGVYQLSVQGPSWTVREKVVVQR